MFGDRLPLLEQYAGSLATDGVVRGLIGPREVPRLWDRHLVNCALLSEEIADGSSVVDIGTGAGLPGVVLACMRTDVAVTLVEPLLRRVTYLDEVVAQLGLANVTVVRARAEELHRHDELAPGFDVVTSRAVSSLPTLLDWCMPLVAPRGSLLALKGSRVADEVRDARSTLTRWRCAAPVVTELGAGLEEHPTYAVRIAWADPDSVSWPAVRDVLEKRRRPRRR